jgi:hypothetical protein
MLSRDLHEDICFAKLCANNLKDIITNMDIYKLIKLCGINNI